MASCDQGHDERAKPGAGAAKQAELGQQTFEKASQHA
jgi:hypothetical protein